jgi:hypothetical protein
VVLLVSPATSSPISFVVVPLAAHVGPVLASGQLVIARWATWEGGAGWARSESGEREREMGRGKKKVFLFLFLFQKLIKMLIIAKFITK